MVNMTSSKSKIAVPAVQQDDGAMLADTGGNRDFGNPRQPTHITAASPTISNAEHFPVYSTVPQHFAPSPFAFVQPFEGRGQNAEAQHNFGPAMVYPPPPPSPSQTSPSKRALHTPTSGANHAHSLYRPPLLPWTTTSRPTSGDRKSPTKSYWTLRDDSFPSATSPPLTSTKRSPSNADEEEAGLALAGLGHGLSAAQMKARRDSVSTESVPKKAKKNPKQDKGEMRKSCSECRRLKAKCDRQFPCSNCRRRGCALVCPDGDLSCMQGKRLVLASTEQLHDRIAQLESALSQAHAKTAESTHPLLASEYLDGGFASISPPLDLKSPKQSTPALVQSTETGHSSPKDQRGSDASFTLRTPKDSDERSASQSRMAVESLLSDDTAAADGKKEDEWVGANGAPALMMGNAANNGFEDVDEHRRVVQRLQKILRVLPPREETKRRAESFWTNSKWYQTVLERDEFGRVYEPAVYAPTAVNPLSPHKLACVLMVLTLETYLDLTEEEDNPAVGRYWDGVQRCFDTRFGWAASVAGVQALGLASMFVALGWRGAKASNFYWLRQMSAAVHQLGLHKDPHPSIDEHERNFRRRVFYETFVIDCLMSINHGQRTGINVDTMETQLPTDLTLIQSTKYSYMRFVKAAVIDIGCRPDESPASWEQIQATAQVIMQYDAKCRAEIHCPLLKDEPLPPKLNAEEATKIDVNCLMRTTMSMCHYKAMLFLYRPSLRRLIGRLRARATNEAVVFDEKDKETVSMTYYACHAITACSRYLIRTHPRLSARFWAVWVQALSAAVSLAALAIWCGPHLESTFIASAYNELTQGVEAVKEHDSKRSRGVLALFPTIQATVHQRYPYLVGEDLATATNNQKGEDMLFALLGGQVTQRGISPTQGPLMNPPMAISSQPGTQSMPLADHTARNGQYQEPPIHQHPPGPMYHDQRGSRGHAQMAYPPPFVIGDTEMVLPFVESQPSAGPFTPYHSSSNGPPMNSYHSSHTHPAGPHTLPMSSVSPNGASATGPPVHQYSAHSVPGTAASGTNTEEMYAQMDSSELWTRLQTFYEPTPAYWGQSVGNDGFHGAPQQTYPPV